MAITDNLYVLWQSRSVWSTKYALVTRVQKLTGTEMPIKMSLLQGLTLSFTCSF